MSIAEVSLEWEILDSTGGPSFSTEILTRGDGNEIRNGNWSHGLWRGDLGSRTCDLAELIYLRDFFLAREGRSQGFRFKDPTDHRVNDTIPVSLTSTTYQLVKRYSANAQTYVRPITRPIDDTLIVTINGSPSTAWTLNLITGILTFNTPPSGTVRTWFDFEIPVRFDTDQFPEAQFVAWEGDEEGLYELGPLPLVEVRVPTTLSPGEIAQEIAGDPLDLGIELGQSAGPQTTTQIRATAGNFEQRIPLEWSRIRGSTAARKVLSWELDLLIAWFRVCRGRLVPFTWKDYSTLPPTERLVRWDTDQFPPAKLLAIEDDERIYELESLPLIEVIE